MSDEKEIEATETVSTQEAAHEKSQLANCVKCQDETSTGETVWKNQLVETLADFQNYKRQVDSERTRWIKEAKKSVVMQLLPTIDDLEMAIKFAPKTEGFQAWLEGLKAWKEGLLRALSSIGITEIDCSGAFDPEMHEAISRLAVEDKDKDNAIIEVYKKGYMLNGIVIRPAQVVVGFLP